jgi:hypothetical protein
MGKYSFDQEEKTFKSVQKQTPPNPTSGTSLFIGFDITYMVFECFLLLHHRFPKSTFMWRKGGEKGS